MLWSVSLESFTDGSEGQIDELHKLVAVDYAFAPDGVEIGEGLFRDGLLGGFSRRLQFVNAIARSDQHVPEFREVRFVAKRAVPRNDLGGIVGERENFVGGGKASTGEGSKCKLASAPSAPLYKTGRSCGSDMRLLVFSWARTVAPAA